MNGKLLIIVFATSLLPLLTGDNKMGLCLYKLQYLNVYSPIKYFANMNLLGNEDLGKNLGGKENAQFDNNKKLIFSYIFTTK